MEFGYGKLKKLLLIALLIVGCGTEPEVHPIVGVWEAIDLILRNENGVVVNHTIYDDDVYMIWIFSQDGVVSTESKNGGIITKDSGTWSITNNKLILITPNGTGIWDYSFDILSNEVLTINTSITEDGIYKESEINFQNNSTS